MKHFICLLLTLLLVTVLFTGCGEKAETETTDSTASAAETVTTVTDTAETGEPTASTTTTTAAATTTTKAPVTTRVPVATKAPTVATVDPHGYQDNHYYVGALQPDGTGLVRPRILFEGEYAVIMHYMYSATKSDPEQTPFEHGGKTYYGEGEGMSPCLFEMTATEIVIKSTNDQSTVMKLVLQSDDKMRVTASTDTFFPVGLLLTPTAQ